MPTKLHWEAAYVAPSSPLARGWERQLDTADAPLFYTGNALRAASYRAWLIDNGVRHVAVPDVPLDYAAVAESRLIQNGVPGLSRAWQDSHWRVFGVKGSTGMVDGPARLLQLDGSAITLQAHRAGTIVIRVRYSPHWSLVTGNGCVSRGPREWTQLYASRGGLFRLKIGLFTNQKGHVEREAWGHALEAVCQRARGSDVEATTRSTKKRNQAVTGAGRPIRPLGRRIAAHRSRPRTPYKQEVACSSQAPPIHARPA